MKDRPFTLFAIVILVLVLIDAVLVVGVSLNSQELSTTHDELTAARARTEEIETAYQKLLERVGGADPFTPSTPKRPTGNLSGNK